MSMTPSVSSAPVLSVRAPSTFHVAANGSLALDAGNTVITPSLDSATPHENAQAPQAASADRCPVMMRSGRIARLAAIRRLCVEHRVSSARQIQVLLAQEGIEASLSTIQNDGVDLRLAFDGGRLIARAPAVPAVRSSARAAVERRNAIERLVTTQRIGGRRELAELLAAEGKGATISSVDRNLKELGVSLGADGYFEFGARMAAEPAPTDSTVVPVTTPPADFTVLPRLSQRGMAEARARRHAAITRLIREGKVHSRRGLLGRLRLEGYPATARCIDRDFEALGARRNPDGLYVVGHAGVCKATTVV